MLLHSIAMPPQTTPQMTATTPAPDLYNAEPTLRSAAFTILDFPTVYPSPSPEPQPFRPKYFHLTKVCSPNSAKPNAGFSDFTYWKLERKESNPDALTTPDYVASSPSPGPSTSNWPTRCTLHTPVLRRR